MENQTTKGKVPGNARVVELRLQLRPKTEEPEGILKDHTIILSGPQKNPIIV